MAESCTIYCVTADSDRLTQAILPYASPGTRLPGDAPVIIQGAEGSLQLTCKTFTEPGDEFSRLVGKTIVFLERQASLGASAAYAISQVSACELAIGVVAAPAFDADDRFEPLVFALAQAGAGLIFASHEVLDPTGATLISFDA